MVSDERIKEFKVILEKERGLEVTWEEAEKGAYQLDALANFMFDTWLEDERRKKKLKESPKGFCLDGVGYSCFICGDGTPKDGNWYDKYGIKCLVCQKAIDKKIIPAMAAKHRDSWYSKYDLESRFNIKYHALNRFMKMGVLKPRIVPDESGRPHCYLFLIKDQKDILPPKKLTESKMVREVKDGKEYFRSLPWYRFVDPWEALKGYKIMDHMRPKQEAEIATTP
jgi:hypothetical protein